jgi:hypothetical protein
MAAFGSLIMDDATSVSDPPAPPLTGVNRHSRTPVCGRAQLYQQIENDLLDAAEKLILVTAPSPIF